MTTSTRAKEEFDRDGYRFIEAAVIEELMDEDARGGPMQRQYPRAVIESIAQSVASSATEYFDMVPISAGGYKPEHHDERTLFKVRDAINSVVQDGTLSDDLITALQNHGILFRERARETAPSATQTPEDDRVVVRIANQCPESLSGDHCDHYNGDGDEPTMTCCWCAAVRP